MIGAVVLDVLTYTVHRHFGIGYDKDVEEAADLAEHVVHLRISLLDIHQNVVPCKIAGRGIVAVRGLPVGFIRSVLKRRVIDHKVEIGVLKRGLLDVFRIGKVTQRPRLIGVAFVNAHQLEAALACFFIEEECVVVVQLESVSGLAGVGVAIPLPRIDLVFRKLALHLFDQRGLVDRVRGLVPVVVRRQIALRESALRTGEAVELLPRLGHEPAWQDAVAAGRAALAF